MTGRGPKGVNVLMIFAMRGPGKIVDSKVY